MAEIVKITSKPEGIENKQTKFIEGLVKSTAELQDEEDEDVVQSQSGPVDFSKKEQTNNDQYSDFEKTNFVHQCKIKAFKACKTQTPYQECRDEELFQCIVDLIEEDKVDEDWLNLEVNMIDDRDENFDPLLEEDDEYRRSLIEKDQKRNPDYQQKKLDKKKQKEEEKKEEEDDDDDDDDDEDGWVSPDKDLEGDDDIEEQDRDKDDDDDDDEEEDDEDILNEEELLYDYKAFDFLDLPDQDIDESSNEEDDIDQGEFKVEKIDAKTDEIKLKL